VEKISARRVYKERLAEGILKKSNKSQTFFFSVGGVAEKGQRKKLTSILKKKKNNRGRVFVR